MQIYNYKFICPYEKIAHYKLFNKKQSATRQSLLGALVIIRGVFRNFSKGRELLKRTIFLCAPPSRLFQIKIIKFVASDMKGCGKKQGTMPSRSPPHEYAPGYNTFLLSPNLWMLSLEFWQMMCMSKPYELQISYLVLQTTYLRKPSDLFSKFSIVEQRKSKRRR